VRSIRWAWWAAAAAVVGGLILGQHFYFSTKLNTLSEQLEQNEALLRDLKEETGAKEPTAPASGSDIQAQIPENQNFEKEKPFRQTQQTNPGSYFLKPNNKSKKPAAAGQKNADNHLQNSATPGTPIAQANNPTASGTELAPLPQADVFEQKNDANGSAQVAAALALPDFLPAKNAWLVADKAPLNLNLPSAIDPVKKPGRHGLPQDHYHIYP
jgi:hypothetical protein